MKSMIMLTISLLLSLSSWARVPDEAFLFSFNVRTLTSVESRDAKILDALELIREVFASEEFQKRVLSHRFSGKRAFAENRGLSNRQIYKSILAGAEKLSEEVDHVMDLDIAFYTDEASRVIGYTYPSSSKIWLNTKYFNRFDAARVAANLTHEWLHKLGYGHSYEWSQDRPYTVPYAVGNIVRELATDLQNDQSAR